MSKYVDINGYTGTSYRQSLLWHYKTDIDREVTNRWFANIFGEGVLSYTPSATGPAVTSITISKGTSLIIYEKNCTNDDIKLGKLDMVLDYIIDLTGYADATYYVYCVWENAVDEYRGVEFYVNTTLPSLPPAVGGYYYVVLGQVTVAGGFVAANNTTGQTVCTIGSGIIGYSGYSGISGSSGISGISSWSGYSGYSGLDGAAAASGYSGYSGESGYSGYSGDNPGSSGYSGYSAYSGYSGTGLQGNSGYSGKSGYSGYSGTAGSECIMIASSDELTPLTSGTNKVTFRMPYGMRLTKVKGSLTTAGSSTTQVDVNENGVTILATKISLAAGIKSNSVTGVGINDTDLADDSEITIDIDSAGTSATGLKVYLIGNKI